MLKAKLNKQDTKHGKMDMPFTNLNRFAGMNKGGNVKRYAEGGDDGLDEKLNQNLNTAIKDSTTFGDAFKSARSGGEKTFMWRGKSYSTELAKGTKGDVAEKKALAKSPGLGQEIAAENARNPPMGSPTRLATRTSNPITKNTPEVRPIGQARFGMKKGGNVKESKSMMNKEVAFFKKKGAPASMVKHEQKEAKEMKFAKGGGIESRGKTKGTVIRMASGGSVSARADGIASKGKTKGKMC